MTARQRGLAWGAGLLIAVGLFAWTAPGVVSLLIASFIVAYVTAPAVDRLERWKLPRALAAALVLVVIGLLISGMIMLLVPALAAQWRRISERLPEGIAYVEGTLIPRIELSFGIDIPDTSAGLAALLREHLPTLGARIAAPLSQAFAKTFGSVIGMLGAIANFVLVPVLAFYQLVRFHQIRPRLEGLVPRRHHDRVHALVGEVDVALAGFVRGQLTVALVLGVLLAIGLSIIGIDGALVIGLLTGLLNMIPFIGTAIGVTLSLLMAIGQLSGWGPILGVVIVFVVTQTLEGNVITPRLVGKSVGLPPVVVILAVLAGGEILGFAGLLLAVPMAAVLKVVLGEAQRAYLASDAYADPAAKPVATAENPVTPAAAPPPAPPPPPRSAV
jgi:predicted PurR-regulated permease PerM